jgi:hypothetical protein
MLDMAGTLLARAPKGLTASLKGVARGVAIVIGISLSIPMQAVDEGVMDLNPKTYIRQILPSKEALCLIRLYGKESAFNVYAIGNVNGKIQSYGIPQLKNPKVAHMSSIEQVNAGIAYIKHRYDTPCQAWKHWQEKGWH